MKKTEAIKTYFEQADAQAPEGGRKVETKEMLELRKADASAFDEVARLSATALGAVLD